LNRIAIAALFKGTCGLSFSIHRRLKFELNETRFGLDMKKYECITKVTTKKCSYYKFELEELEQFLKKKGWWYDF
jgi:Fic family protein